ncbi:hypothetical protein [Actinophytocola oryzae]|uniref:Uncharacterized protein n=1 Tax=Actinophytocola oryzae TaxID=502181 RepID=A0A4R7V017_9PSEU|nr:hypothetical protein [Actinophytocola oryzae]TDV42539.1 hypothetical protein CLV71_1178 [Actinophytocola oryzae]
MGIKDFTARHRSILRAIADGRGQIVVNRRANLAVDGLWCDFSATNDLVGNGLVGPAWSAPAGATAPAVLTTGGAETLALLIT